jgi:hypothetical protein
MSVIAPADRPLAATGDVAEIARGVTSGRPPLHIIVELLTTRHTLRRTYEYRSGTGSEGP